MCRNLTLFFLLLGCLTVVSHSSKILAVIPTPSPSHFIFAKGFLSTLTDVGHEVTLVTPLENKKEQNYRFVSIPEIRDLYLQHISAYVNGARNSGIKKLISYEFWKFAAKIYDVSVLYVEIIFQNAKFQKLLEENFDLVIIELINYEALLGLGFHFNCPVVVLSSFWPTLMTNDVTGNPTAIAYVPYHLLPFTDHMTFSQRMINFFMITFSEILRKSYHYPKHEELLHKYLPNTPDFYSVLHNVSLTFLNSHESFAYVSPLMPNSIPVGGVHIPTLKKLPQDLQAYLDSASDGFIFISFGTVLENEHFEFDTKKSLMASFGKLKQKIIWKWDDEIATEGLQNVKIGKWFPQIEILAHPNIKLFVTHGGIGSVTEAMWFGVPMLGIPMFADQYHNVHRVTALECGLTLQLEDINEHSFTHSINELLSNPKYSKNIKKRSELFRDQPMSPQEKVRYWIDYVIKHKGAFHLRPPGFDLCWFQSLFLDVNALMALILPLLVVLIGIIYLIFSCLKKIILLPYNKSELQKIVNEKKNK